ncbi:MAG: alkaline phosphatase [Cyanobacteria bacterium J06597_16]
MSSNVIFIHPDGADPSHFAAARFESVGPDGRLNWDLAPKTGVYLGHLDDAIVATSNAGAVVHAYGIKAVAPSYGFDENEAEYQSLAALQGKNVEGSAADATILEEAIAAGRPTAVINSGFIAEPGTGVFLADAVSRRDREGITAQIVESGVSVIMGAGEIDYLPVGTVGFFGEEGTRSDGRNLIEEAEDMGYTVVFTREQLESLSADTERVLGIFAADDTYNDVPEGALIADGFVDENGELITYGQPGNPNPPTVAEMLDATLKLEVFSQEEDGFMIVLEEEGTDNFGNNNNARGTIDATLRADAAIGVARDFIENVNSNTFVVTAADSAGGSLEVDDIDPEEETVGETVGTLTTQRQLDADGENSGITVPFDGTTGSDTAPFVSAPDANGNSYNFGVTWAGLPDFAGSIVSKAYGEGAERLPATLDNTAIYRLMYESLFDVSLEAPEGVPDDLAGRQAPEPTAEAGNVIFIHPDGTSPSHYAAARFASEGTDGRLNWDQMSHAGVYLGHIEDRLVSTSNAGAVVHAYGTKPFAGSYGFDAPVEDGGEEVVSLSGSNDTIMQEAQAAGKAVGIINSGFIAEPGTGVFLADVDNRGETEEITAEILAQLPNVILGAGETDYLPEGTVGVFGEEGTRTDGRNLIEEAEAAGYTVVFNREELMAVDPNSTERLLGIFAAEDTYNDLFEDELRRDGFVDENGDLILYGQPPLNPNPPTVAEMLEVALPILDADPDGFFLVLEEEATDNFGNDNNAAGTIEAAIRADEAIGVALDFVDNTDPNTLVITAADSDAGGLEVDDVPIGGFGLDPEQVESGFTLRAQAELAAFGDEADGVLVQVDDQDGSNDLPGFSTDVFEPFTTGAPDADGDVFDFGVAWATRSDVNGGIVSKSYGLNAELLPATTDNTDIYRVMYQTLFGTAPEDVSATRFVGTSSDDELVGTAANESFIALAGNDLAAGGLGDDIILGGDGDDILRGDLNNRSPQDGGAGGNDIIFGGEGNDRIGGKAGNDILLGDMGDDLIWGDDGDDIVFGGEGNDILVGDNFSSGSGSDLFVFGTENGTDTILDFAVGTDFIGLITNELTFADLTLTQDGVNTSLGVTSSGKVLAVLQNVQATDLAESSFVSVSDIANPQASLATI